MNFKGMSDSPFWIIIEVNQENTNLLLPDNKQKTPQNHMIKRGYPYPEPGSNRHGNESTGV
jgi:hypothetical protein